jgi:hypothetical protein
VSDTWQADYVGKKAKTVLNFKRVVSVSQAPVSVIPDISDGSFDPRERKLFADREYKKGNKHHARRISKEVRSSISSATLPSNHYRL